MTVSRRALLRASAAAFALATAPGHAAADPSTSDQRDILVTADRPPRAGEATPGSTVSIDAGTLRQTTNVVNAEDALKYLPSLIVRKRHIGDTQAPLATRTSGVGSSARSLVYADGALLSALIGNNNSNASPRWSLVSPEEIARVDVLYGPFAAAYPGNAIGAVVNITTRLPDRLEATLSSAVNVQAYDQYGTHQTLPTHQFAATLGDRFGPLAVFASAAQTVSNGQPLLFVTATRPTAASAGGVPATGGYDDVNRTGAAIRVLGASGIEHQRQDQLKLKLALDVTPTIQLRYVGGLFLNHTIAAAQSYLRDGTGVPAYAGTFAIDGRAYTLATSAFDAGVYRQDERHWSHALTASGSGRLAWSVIGTLYDYARDDQRSPTTALPTAQGGGAGTITRLGGTGWATLDARASLEVGEGARHVLSGGVHYDRFTLASDRYAVANWLKDKEGSLNQRSAGRTATAALWGQDAWKVTPALTFTLGGRYESWRAYDGANLVAAGTPLVVQPRLSAARFSPKATLAWDPRPGWTLRGSFGEAYRFPTVGELYQIVTTPVVAVPNPNLRPERAVSEEIALEKHDARGALRVAVFNEVVNDALIAQTAPLNGTTTLASFVQNVDRTRARGVETSFQRTALLPRIDLSGSLTYADAQTRQDTAFPAAVGHALPSVPRWKASLVATWRPTPQVSLTAAGRYASRMYGTLDNSDVVGNTYQGFYHYAVVDLRAEFAVSEHLALGLGVDNVGNDRYFLFHPFPERSFQGDVRWRL